MTTKHPKPYFHFDTRQSSVNGTQPNSYKNFGSAANGRRKVVHNLKVSLKADSANSTPVSRKGNIATHLSQNGNPETDQSMLASQNGNLASRGSTPVSQNKNPVKPTLKRTVTHNFQAIESSVNMSDGTLPGKMNQNVGNWKRTSGVHRMYTKIDHATESKHSKDTLDVKSPISEVETIAVSENDCKVIGQSESHPIERVAGWTLQEILNFAKYSQDVNIDDSSRDVPSVDLCKVLGVYTVRELMDYFNNEQVNDRNTSVSKDYTAPEDRTDFSGNFEGFTLLEIAEYFNDIKEHEQVEKPGESAGEKADISSLFDQLTGYSLRQVMNFLNAKDCSANASSTNKKIVNEPMDITGLQSRYALNEDMNSKGNNYNNTHKPLRRTDSVASSVYFADPCIEMNYPSGVTDNSIMKSVTEAKNTGTQQVFNAQENTSHGTIGNNYSPIRNGNSGLMNRNQNFSDHFALHTLDEVFYDPNSELDNVQAKAALTLYPADVDGLDIKSFKALKDSNTIEIWNDFCLRFGHSGICPYGSFCKFRNKNMHTHCSQYCVSKTDPFAKMEHGRDCLMTLKLERELELGIFENKYGKACEKACQLCHKVVPTKASIFNRLYGILLKCEHTLCIECAEKCRTDGSDGNRFRTIKCKLCGIDSSFYIASPRWVEGDKREFLIKYLDALRYVTCKYCTEGSNSELIKGTKVCHHGRAIKNNDNMFTLDA